MAFLLGRLVTPAMRRVAVAVGFVDGPDRRRKFQEAPIPLGGGVAVWLATWLGWGAGLVSRSWAPGDRGVGPGLGPTTVLAAASFLVLVLGVVDDRSGMRGVRKLAGQVVAATVLVASGVRVDSFGGFGLEFGLGIFAGPITVLGIVLVINAFNLIDGMDGFCGSLGLVASLAIAFLSFAPGRWEDAMLGMALAGGLAAFLVDNLPPARIYLGDAGSMTVGMMVSFLSIRACSDGPGTAVSLPLLAALLVLPLLDVAAALGRRWLTGRSLFASDRGHIHHRLRDRLGGTAAALGVGAGLATLAASGAVLGKAWGAGDLVAGLVVVTTLVLLGGTHTFGGPESRLLIFRLRSTIAGLLTDRRAGGGAVRHECHLLGDGDWAGVWDALIREGESAGLGRIELAIDMPAAGETYHGQWSLPESPGGPPNWSVVHPLRVDGIEAGTLRVAGSLAVSRPRYLDHVEALVRILEDHLRSITPEPAPPLVVRLPAVGVGRAHLNRPGA